jgi:N-hydroxyarylamine O-acetyltransferase
MNLDAYLDRIAFAGPARANLATLQALHRAHAAAIPFENLDVQLRRPISLEPTAIFDKLVTRRRGGWCYEQNGLMGWALQEIGFRVTRLGAGVLRDKLGDVQLGNHLCLRVDLDEPFLVDVGFGGSLGGPLPLREIDRGDAPYRVSLSRTDDGYWRFTEQAHGDPFSFDFRDEPADEALLLSKRDFLQGDPTSNFVLNLVVQQRQGETHVSLRGRVLQETASAGVEKRILGSADEFSAALRERFGLDLPEAASLWPQVCARHDVLFPPEAAD